MMIDKDTSNFEWLSGICNTKAESWHQDAVLKTSQIENSKFYKRERDYYDDYINPAHIVGIEYGYAYNCFNEITWLDLINRLKRFDRIRRNMSSYEELLEHAHNDYNETKTVAKYGNQYITLAGQRGVRQSFRFVPQKHICKGAINSLWSPLHIAFTYQMVCAPVGAHHLPFTCFASHTSLIPH